MTWLRRHYDRVALLAGVLSLFVSLVLIGWNTIQIRKKFLVLRVIAARKPVASLPLAVEVAQARERLRRAPQWSFSGRSGLFVPEKHYIDGNGFPATLQSGELHPPVPNEWLEQFGLPITDADVLSQDPDRDGFTNLDEWEHHTDPKDRNSHPAFVTKLKIKSFAQEPFRLVFASWVNDTFAINTNDLKEPTQFIKLGDPIRGTKFKLLRFIEKFEPNRFGTKMDVSELTLENQETKEQVNLVKEKIMISPESVANFIYAWGGNREFAVKKDQEFSLKPDERAKYKLVDVQSTKALIVNTQNPSEPIEVGLFTP